MRNLNFLLAVMFLIFAFLQVNDPDPVIWILIYGTVAVTCILAMFQFFPRKLLIPLLIILTLYSLVFIPSVKVWWRQEDRSILFDDLAKMEHLYIEESREFLGLIICIVVLTFYIIRSYRKKG